MTSENPKAPVYYMDVYDNLVSAPRELVPMSGVSLTNTPAALDNARLLMDALNTRHECGLSPRELLEGYRELRKALDELYDECGGYMPDTRKSVWRDAAATLAKHKEV